MQIRAFAPADQAAAQAVIQGGMHDRWGDDYDPAYNTDTDDIATNYTTGGNHFVVAVDAGELIGTGALVVEAPIQGRAVARIVRMSVAPSHRRRGIAKAIVADLVARARHDGFDTVLVSTDTPWTDAIALYEVCGFARVGVDQIDTHLELRLT